MKTKYPILLVHGIVLKDLKFIKSFGKIDRILRICGFTVYKSKIDGFGSIETNAEELKEEILEILKKENCSKINIIAHSKGGLDSKYMIMNLGMEDKVASLTTLCTPHKGSPIASFILKFPRFLLKFIAFWINFWYKIFGDKHPNSLKVCEELSLVNDVREELMGLPKKVYCQSYSTTMKRKRDDFVMGIPLAFSHYFEKEKESDGLVSNESSEFGEYKGCWTEESYSHSEMIDFMLNEKKKDKLYAFYTSLCEDLMKRGF